MIIRHFESQKRRVTSFILMKTSNFQGSVLFYAQKFKNNSFLVLFHKATLFATKRSQTWITITRPSQGLQWLTSKLHISQKT